MIDPGIAVSGKMNTARFKIDGMHCDGCAQRIETLLEKQPGVREASVSFPDRLARIKYNQHAVSEDDLVEVIKGSGFRVASRLS
jgi:copper chaperone